MANWLLYSVGTQKRKEEEEKSKDMDVDACIFLVQNLPFSHNPIPPSSTPPYVPRPASPGTFAATIERLRVFLPILRPADGRRPQSPLLLKKIASISTLNQKPKHDGPVTPNLTQNVKA